MSQDDLHKKYGIQQLSKSVEDSEDVQWETVTLSTEQAETIELATSEQGRPNVQYISGKPINKDRAADFEYQARGLRGDPGTYHHTYVSDPLVSSTVDGGWEGLVSGQWDTRSGQDTPEDQLEAAETHAQYVKRNLLGKPSHWRDFLKAWTLGDRVFGFMLWEIIDREDGGVSKLAPRMPNTVDKWLFSQDGREWVATEFAYPGSGSNVTISADDLLLYSTGVGLDLEGRAALRSVVRWVETKQLVTQIEIAADESHGAGYVFVTSDGPYDDEDEAQKVVDVLSASTGTDVPIIKVKGGYGIEWLSPNGKLPDFESLRRYCDEQISLALQSTGSLVGLGDTGSYALADSKDQQENVRRIRFYGQSVCDLINEHLIPRICRNAIAAGTLPQLDEDLFPRLTFSLATEARDPKWIENVVKASQAGLLGTVDRDTQNRVREYLDLSPLPEEEPTGFPDDPDDPDDPESVDPNGGDGENADPQPVEATHETDAEKAIRLGLFKPMNHTGITLSNYDPERLRKWVMESNNEMGAKMRKVARKHRDEYVRLTAGVSDPARVTRISQNLRNKYVDEYAGAIRYALNRLAIKGSASQLRELGVLKARQGTLALPNVPKDAGAKVYQLQGLSDQFHRHIEAQSKRIADHAANVTKSYLDSNAFDELAPAAPERLKPQIPTQAAFATQAKRYTQRTFTYGREEVVQRIKNEAEARGIEDQRVVMEISSVMEANSCDPCKDNDGRRYFLESDAYERDKPPYWKHEGPSDTCLCLANAILPSEAGYEELLDELGEGFSQVDSGMGLSQDGEIKGLLGNPLIRFVISSATYDGGPSDE